MKETLQMGGLVVMLAVISLSTCLPSKLMNDQEVSEDSEPPSYQLLAYHEVIPGLQPVVFPNQAEQKTFSKKESRRAPEKVVSRFPEKSWEHSALTRIPEVRKKYGETIRKAAKANEVDPDFILAIIMTESVGEKDAVSHTGAVGLMQITGIVLDDLDTTADVRNPKENIRIGVAYLASLRDRYGYSTTSGIAVAYNVGPNAAKNMTERAIKQHDYAQKVAFILENL